ncbi:DJ-1 family glyoxalase III [Ruminococcus sp. Marseille-P6503]|uniref:DJ-1 family glyoxalase III n=1 Tax=Ruminococcus sp. Marseille-P6503 TaxID=2364796 RepID=UPI000F53CB2F|nr:DJ-1 family glyoxalase III [Ruminococcus sp. Marseille-P6503]
MVYVFLADGFEELEAIAPIDILRRAGAEVKTVGIGSREVTAAHGVKFIADITVKEIKLNNELEMIVLPGGMPGADNLENCPEVQAAIDYCSESDKLIGAICAAPKILGHKGLLNGRYATCFPGFESQLADAKVTSQLVTVDGTYITAKGAGAAIAFALKLVEAMFSKAKAEQLEATLQCR